MKVSWWDQIVKVINEVGCDLWIIVRKLFVPTKWICYSKKGMKPPAWGIQDLVLHDVLLINGGMVLRNKLSEASDFEDHMQWPYFIGCRSFIT